MTDFEAIPVSSPESTPRLVLGEGPVWNAASGTVLWVDIVRGTVFEGSYDGSGAHPHVEVIREERFDVTTSAVAPGPDGSLLVAAQDRLVRISADGTRTDVQTIVQPGDPSRTNDGGCDPAGRYLIGTLELDERGGHDRLFRLEDDGSLLTIDSDLGISNGLGWSPDRSTMYSADTLAKTIWARDYDAASGAIGERRVGVAVDGNPDGICIDARGYIWTAVWGTGEVRCHDLAGNVVDVVTTAAPYVTSACFVGADLDRMLLTTATRDLDDAGRARYPDCGKLFVVDVGVTGVPTTPWRG